MIIIISRAIHQPLFLLPYPVFSPHIPFTYLEVPRTALSTHTLSHLRTCISTPKRHVNTQEFIFQFKVFIEERRAEVRAAWIIFLSSLQTCTQETNHLSTWAGGWNIHIHAHTPTHRCTFILYNMRGFKYIFHICTLKRYIKHTNIHWAACWNSVRWIVGG